MKAWTTLFLMVSGSLFGQAPARLTFEVASVRAVPERAYPGGARSGGLAPPIQGDPEQITFDDVSLVGVLCRAYDLKPLKIHAPEWMSDRRYRIMAKIPAEAPKGRIPEMLQNLLADRFQMKLHWETKVESGFSLTVAKGGPKLQKAARDAGNGYNVLVRSNGHQEFKAITMNDMANGLTANMGRPVVDMTGLAGAYDITLDAAPDSMPGFRFGNVQDSPFPTIFDALRQLGLNLAPGKVSTKYLVIDSALKTPTEN